MSVVKLDDFMLPRKGTDMKAWSVVACDQYTSSPEYWDRVRAQVGDKPSTLNLICPEANLSKVNEVLPHITAMSEQYARELLVSHHGGVLVKRSLKGGVRWGIVCKIDLEAYTYDGSKTPIRATEGTVTERIPPRLAVKRACVLDTPHVMCLIDDREGAIIEPLIRKVGELEKLYDMELMENGGHLEGYHISYTGDVTLAIEKAENKAMHDGKPFILVGDGNHSLASAKALYEEYKAAGDDRAAYARYALVEIVNLQSDGINFEPIHRVMYNAPDFCEYLNKVVHGDAEYTLIKSDGKAKFTASSDAAKAYEQVQSAIDTYLKEHKEAEVDYIHGESDLTSLCEKRNAIGLLMPALSKNGFFDFVAKSGALPRKSFSMGEAYEKRYYTEVADLRHH